MRACSRRQLLAGLSGALSAPLFPRLAAATLMRGLALASLVNRSHHVLLATPVEKRSLYKDIGGGRSIVTETRLVVEDAVLPGLPAERDPWVCTLGGVVADEGELVHGQAELRLGALCMVFLRAGGDQSLWVEGMAQGHYPIEVEARAQLLRSSPHLPKLLQWEGSAVKALVGTELTTARRLVTAARRP